MSSIVVIYRTQAFDVFQLLLQKYLLTLLAWFRALHQFGTAIVAAFEDLKELMAHCKVFPEVLDETGRLLVDGCLILFVVDEECF